MPPLGPLVGGKMIAMLNELLLFSCLAAFVTGVVLVAATVLL